MFGLTSTTAFLRTFLRFKTKSCQTVSTLVGLCAEDSRKRAATKSPENLTAYEHVLRGRYYWPDCRGSVEDWNRAREEFQKALELDPSGSAAKVTRARGRYAHHVVVHRRRRRRPYISKHSSWMTDAAPWRRPAINPRKVWLSALSLLSMVTGKSSHMGRHRHHRPAG